MELNGPEKKQRTEYGSAQRPVVIMCYHVQEKDGAHRLVSINDHAVRDLHGDREGFERRLGERYRSFELVGSCKAVIDLVHQTATFAEGTHELKRRCEELRAKHGEMCVEPWMAERLDQQKPDKTAPTPVTTAPDNDPSESRDNSANELLAAVSSAIFNRLAPVIAGTMKQGPAKLAPIGEGFMWLRVTPEQMSRLLSASSAESDVAAAVAFFPAGVRARITARVDARVHASRAADSLVVTITQCNEPEFLFNELSEPYDATHTLHLVCDPAKDTGHTFVMIEISDGKFVPKGWVDGETAARSAAEGAKSAEGRPPGLSRHDGQIEEVRTYEISSTNCNRMSDQQA